MSVDQGSFCAALLAPDAPVPAGLSGPDGQPAGKRFDIYRNNVVSSLTEALETAFPVVRKLVGDNNFKALARAYLREHPPRSPLLMRYGAEMADFVARFPPTQTIGYLPDVARLEQALREAYHAADAQPIAPEALGAVPPDRLMGVRLGLAPALRILRSPWPVHAIWSYNARPGSPKPEPRAQDVAVVRPGFDPEPVLLPPGVARFLTAIAADTPLGDAVDAATRDADAFDLTGCLGLLLSTGTITDLKDNP